MKLSTFIRHNELGYPYIDQNLRNGFVWLTIE